MPAFPREKSARKIISNSSRKGKSNQLLSVSVSQKFITKKFNFTNRLKITTNIMGAFIHGKKICYNVIYAAYFRHTVKVLIQFTIAEDQRNVIDLFFENAESTQYITFSVTDYTAKHLTNRCL